MTSIADTRIVATQRRVMRREFITCRSIGHSWYEFFAGEMDEPLFGDRLSLRCERCGTERHDLIDSMGRVGSRDYRYVEGYQTTGDEKLSRREYRLLLLDDLRDRRKSRRGKK